MRATVVIVYWSLYWNLVWPVQRYQGRSLPQCYPSCLPPLFWQQVYKFYAIILALRNHHSHYYKTKAKQNQKWDCLYLYQLPGAHTENWRNSHPKHVNETIFNWGRLASEIVMAARGVIVTWLPGVMTWLPGVTTVFGHGLTHWGRVTRDAYIRQ